MTFDQIILWIVAVGVVIGGVDKLIGNKFGLGEKFDDGFNMMSALAIPVAGIVVLAPVFANLLAPVLIPVFGLIGADPAMFASIIANDMGGYPLAMSLAVNQQVGLMAGLITASMLGCTLVFTIPVGFGIVVEKDRPYFATGLLIGLTTIPIGSIIGGLVAGFDAGLVIINNIPIAVFSILLAIGLKAIPNLMIKGCIGFGKVLGWITVIGVIVGSFAHLTGIDILPGADTMLAGLEIVAYIVIVLIGIMPVVELIIRLLKNMLGVLGKLLDIDSISSGGLLITLANPLPIYSMIKDMNKKGKVLNACWFVSATALLGDHLGFTAGVNPDMIKPMIIGKLSAAVAALIIAIIYIRSMKVEEEASASS